VKLYDLELMTFEIVQVYFQMMTIMMQLHLVSVLVGWLLFLQFMKLVMIVLFDLLQA
jgi:hypothetical protein